MSVDADIMDAVTDVLQREGADAFINDPADKGGRTQYGISEKANPQAWLDGKVTEQEAREIYVQKYVIFPKWHLIPTSHAPVQKLLIDWSVISGPQLVTEKLQGILGVKVDGTFGPKSLMALKASDVQILNNRLVAERIRMIGRIVGKNPSQAKWCLGWLNRALDFLL